MILVKLFKKLVQNSSKEKIRNFVLASYDEYYEKIYFYAYAKCKESSKDVVQETFKRFQIALIKGLKMNFQKDEEYSSVLKNHCRKFK